MTDPALAHPVRVGVLLPPPPADLGEWLADASSFDAAGADALWVDTTGTGLDPLALTAALASLTVRSLLVTAAPAADGGYPALARTLATVDRLSRGRVRFVVDPPSTPPPARRGVFRPVPADPDAFEHVPPTGEPERWLRVPSPDGRASWRASVQAATDRGFRGLMVPAGPRLLDILRNPDDPGQRHDLQLAQG